MSGIMRDILWGPDWSAVDSLDLGWGIEEYCRAIQNTRGPLSDPAGFRNALAPLPKNLGPSQRAWIERHYGTAERNCGQFHGIAATVRTERK